LEGVWGFSPRLISSPFLARKGDGGMVESVIKHSPGIALTLSDPLSILAGIFYAGYNQEV